MSISDLLRHTGYAICQRVRITADGAHLGQTGTVVGALWLGPVIYLRIQIDGQDEQIHVQDTALTPESRTVRAAP